MARPLRIQYPNAMYHAMNRGLGRQRIFLFDDDYGVFLETIKETSWIFDIRVIAYCLMSNHYHLLIQTPKGNLSRAMRHLNGVYTQRFNRLHKTDGPLFRGRYKAILVQEDEYLTHLIRYIHLNPLQANLTDDLSKYPHTSHQAYLKGKDQEVKDRGTWLHTRLGLSFFSNKLNQAITRYRVFLKDGLDPQTKAFYNRKHQNPILGDQAFIDKIKEKYVLSDQAISSEIPEQNDWHRNRITKTVIQAVSKNFNVKENSLYQSRRGQTNLPRLIAVALTRELSGLRLGQIASLFKLRTYKNASMCCYRIKGLLDKDLRLNKRYNQLRKCCVSSSQLEI